MKIIWRGPDWRKAVAGGRDGESWQYTKESVYQTVWWQIYGQSTGGYWSKTPAGRNPMLWHVPQWEAFPRSLVSCVSWAMKVCAKTNIEQPHNSNLAVGACCALKAHCPKHSMLHLRHPFCVRYERTKSAWELKSTHRSDASELSSNRAVTFDTWQGKTTTRVGCMTDGLSALKCRTRVVTLYA